MSFENGGIIDQYVQAAVFGNNRFHKSGGLLWISYVRLVN